MRLLALCLTLLLAGCSVPPNRSAENRSTASYLTRVSPAAALDSVSDWAEEQEDLTIERADDSLILRDTREGETNVARVSARSRPDGVTEVTAQSQYRVHSPQSFRDLTSSVYLGQTSTSTDPFLLPTYGEGCESEEAWRASDPPVRRSAPAEPISVDESAPKLIGGMGGLQRRTEYPESSRRSGSEGKVYTTFVVTETGAVECVQVISAPDMEIAKAVHKAVSASVFEPGMQRGKPVNVRFTLPHGFWLR